MGLRIVLVILSIFLFFPLHSFQDEIKGGRILFLIHHGHTEDAIALYEKNRVEWEGHDLELLQQICLSILEKGAESDNPEIQLLTLFGAGISLNEKALPLIERAILSPIPQLQLIALNFLSAYQNDHANFMLNQAMSSAHPLIRLEAAFQLAQKKYPTAVGQLEALMCKLDSSVHFIFPPLFAMIGNDASIKILRKFLTHPDALVRLETIKSIAEYERDDLVPQIRSLATHRDASQQEACLIALGSLKDEKSLEKIRNLSQSDSSNIRLAALQALYRLGEKEVRLHVEKEAESGNLFAIAMLGEMAGSEDLLFTLSNHSNLQIRVNATIALLERCDPRSSLPLSGLLISDSRDLAIVKLQSAAKGLTAWKAIPSAVQNLKEDPTSFELALNVREDLLIKAVDLPEKNFLQLADLILEKQQNDLVPILIELLVTRNFEGSVEILEKHRQKLGAPLVRSYCNLALFRLKEEGPYLDIIRQWVQEHKNQDLIQFRTFLPWELREKNCPYQLTPQETTRLFVESLEEMAKLQDEASMELLLETLAKGHTKYRYIIAGLLLRCTQ